MRNIYYRFKTSMFFNYPYDRIVDEKIKSLIKIGIKSIEDNDYTCIVTFKDNSTYLFWNVNKYYAWLKQGSFKNETDSFSYIDARPSAKTMYLFDKAISEHLSKIN